MTKAIVIDFARTILFPKDKNYTGQLNQLHIELSGKEGNYRFLDHFELNSELLNFLANLKGTFQLYLYTTGTIQDMPEIKPQLDKVFDKVFTVLDTDTDKRTTESYSKLAAQIGLSPDELMFIDDNQSNLNAALKAGFLVMQYSNNASVIKRLQDLQSENATQL